MNILIKLSICLLFTFSPFNIEAKLSEVDRVLKHALANDSIIGFKQIKIPGYPNAYNPSLIPYKEGYLLSFRYISRYPENFKNSPRTDASFIGIVRLDKNFKALEKTVQLLNVVSYSSRFSLTAEDARLLSVGDRIFIFFNDLGLSQMPGTFAMYFGELVEDRGVFHFKEPAKPLNYLQAIQVEKNWSPFLSENKVHLIYSDQPRIILEMDLDTGYCQEVARTNIDWNWKWGQIRGGTPAHLVNDVFLTFFHSSFPAKISKGRAFVMGAYTFDKEPPFSIRTMTLQPLGDLKDYTQDNGYKIIFPGGMVIENNLIHVAWGKADKQIFITTFDKQKLLTSMKPLE